MGCAQRATCRRGGASPESRIRQHRPAVVEKLEPERFLIEHTPSVDLTDLDVAYLLLEGACHRQERAHRGMCVLFGRPADQLPG